MAKAFDTNRDMARIEAAVIWTERQPRHGPQPPRRRGELLPRPQREFELAEELEPNKTADAYHLKYVGDGDSCTDADYEADTDRPTFKVGGGAMPEIREETFAAGVRGQCRKDPGRKFWTIFQIGCQPRYF